MFTSIFIDLYLHINFVYTISITCFPPVIIKMADIFYPKFGQTLLKIMIGYNGKDNRQTCRLGDIMISSSGSLTRHM